MLIPAMIGAVISSAAVQPPLAPKKPAIIVSIKWEEDSRDAEKFIRDLSTLSNQQNISLRAILGPEVKIEPLYSRPNPAPKVYEIPEYSATWLMKRYIRLSFPANHEINGKIEELRRSRIFGYVDAQKEVKFEATPLDPHWDLANSQPPPYGGQNWAHQRLNIPAAWDYLTAPSNLSAPHPSTLTGGTRVVAADSGVYQQTPLSTQCDGLPHEDLIANLRPQLSIGYARTPPANLICDEVNPFPKEVPDPGGHGTHVLGLIGANANNNIGVAGVCWSCQLGISPASGEDFIEAIIRQGPAIINFSFGYGYDVRPVCNFQSSDHPLCPLLQLAEEREEIIVAAAGNDLTLPRFPAYHRSVIGVGGLGFGLDGSARPVTWDDRAPNGAGCPQLAAPNVPIGWAGPTPVSECGSNDDASRPLRFFAPAKDVLSTFGLLSVWNQPAGCGDAAVISNTPVRPGWQQFQPTGYDYCTGTSMATPLMVGAMALARSAHPVLQRSSFISVLENSRVQINSHLTGPRAGLLDTKAAIETLLGKLGPVQLQNRLTPMFVLRNTLFGTPQVPSHNSWLYTVYLPVLYAAMDNSLYDLKTDGSGFYSPPSSWSYNEGFGSPVQLHRINESGTNPIKYAPGFDAINASAYFYIYTAPKNPFSTEQAMRPLYRLSFDDRFRGNEQPVQPPYYVWCLGRDHAYAINQVGMNWFLNTDFCPPGTPFNQETTVDQSFRLERLEGYLLPTCPLEGGCNFAGAPFQCVHIRGRQTVPRQEGEDWALVPYWMLPSTPGHPATFADYTVTPQGAPTPASGEQQGCLGYAAMNRDTDSDGIIDGAELSFFKGPSISNPHLDEDIDNDGLTDGDEYQPLGLVISNPLAACSVSGSAECNGIFRNGFESPESFYD